MIDDDLAALQLLGIYLKVFNDVEIVGTAETGTDGLQLIQQQQPDIAFMDIDMPGISGIELARQLKEQNSPTQVVFTSAFHHYAYEAIHTEPLDYLTKPFGAENITRVLDRFRQKNQKKKIDKKIEILINSQRTQNKLKFQTRLGMIIVHPEEIVMMRSQANNCNLYLSDGTEELVLIGLQKASELLTAANFFRVSRSALINIQYLRRVDKKQKICMLQSGEKMLSESLSRQNIAFLDRYGDFPTL